MKKIKKNSLKKKPIRKPIKKTIRKPLKKTIRKPIKKTIRKPKNFRKNY